MDLSTLRGVQARGRAQRPPERCLPPTPRPLRSASAPFRAYRRAIGTIFGLPFFATRPLPNVLHLQTPVCKERHVGEGATSVMRVSRKPYLLHVGMRESEPKRSGEAGLACQRGLHELWTGLRPPRGSPIALVRGGGRLLARWPIALGVGLPCVSGSLRQRTARGEWD